MLDGLYTFVQVYRSENGNGAYPSEEKLKLKAANIYWELRELMQCCMMYPDVELPPCIAFDIHQLCEQAGFFLARLQLAQNNQEEPSDAEEEDGQKQDNMILGEDSDDETSTVIPATMTMTMTMNEEADTSSDEEDTRQDTRSTAVKSTAPVVPAILTMTTNEESDDDLSTVAMMAPEEDIAEDLSIIMAAVAAKKIQSTMTQFFDRN